MCIRDSSKEDSIDRSSYDKLVDDAVETISKYGDFEWFVSDDPYIPKQRMEDFMNIPEDADEELQMCIRDRYVYSSVAVFVGFSPYSGISPYFTVSYLNREPSSSSHVIL